LKVSGLVLIILLAVGIIFAGCQHGGSELKFGVSAPLTGDIAALGQSTKNGILLAEEEINAQGGLKLGSKQLKVKFIIEDDENKPETTATVFQKLINQDKVVAIIGSQSSKCSNAGAPIAESAKIPQISPWSTNPNVTKGRKYVFRACFIDPFQGKVVARLTREKFKAKTAAVMYDVASDYNKGIAEVFKTEFTKAGGTIVAFETYNTKDTDFSAQLTKIKGTNPEVLFLPNYFNEVPLQVQQARKLGVTAKIIGSDSWDNPELLNLGGDVMEDSYFTNHYSPDVDSSVAKGFISKYQRKFKNVPDAAAALTYDAAYLLFQAVEKAGKANSQAIRDAVAATSGFKGVTGEITYSGSGDPIKGAVIIRVENGKFIFDSAVNP
jgi:branched-chain amino acid transport system substrate-binding protein